ncbi:MAG: hypothetical protein IJ364_04640 [Oscillospiraceae bacterium]|nr:hypothetical protein [Oscillospiraceae bacterium]
MKKRILLIMVTVLSAVCLCGAACDHDWQSDSGDFTSLCTKCGVEVQGASKDELAMQRYLVGNWDCEDNWAREISLYDPEGTFDTFTCMHIYFDGKGNARFRDSAHNWQNCTYEFSSAEYDEYFPDDIDEDSDYTYGLNLYDPDGNYYSFFVLVPYEDAEPELFSDIVLVPEVSLIVVYDLTKTDDVTAALEGEWVCEDKGYSLELADDRSLSGDVFGLVQGQWQANRKYTEASTLCSKVMIAFREGDGMVFHTAILSAPDTEALMSAQRESCTLSFTVDGEELIFTPVSHRES